MEKAITFEDQLALMQRDWDARAKENARYYIATSRKDWTDNDFFASGDEDAADNILDDISRICQGKDPKTMRVIEIGCGTGRVTRALSRIFGEVHGVDVSGEMIARAQVALKDRPNAHVYHNNGCDLKVVPPLEFDFAYSCIVFQHIPNREIIETYVREVHRLLRPGSLFKFQVQGYTQLDINPTDTWVGVPFSVEQVQAMAERCGFEVRDSQGAGTQMYWLWFIKK